MKWTDYVILILCIGILFMVINIFCGLYKKTQTYCKVMAQADGYTQAANEFAWDDNSWSKSYPYEIE